MLILPYIFKVFINQALNKLPAHCSTDDEWFLPAMTGFCFWHQHWQNVLTHKCSSTHVIAKKKKKNPGEESKWRVWANSYRLWDVKLQGGKVILPWPWFQCVCWLWIEAHCPSVSVHQRQWHSEGLCIGSKFTKGSHSHSKGIVSRMWDRWLTWSVFLRLAFDLRYAFMLPLMWMGCKCRFTQIAAKSLFTFRAEDKILETAVGP